MNTQNLSTSDLILSSESQPNQTSVASTILWRISYGIADGCQLLAVGLLLDFLIFEGVRIGMPARLFAIALLLFGLARSSGGSILIAIQASLFLREPTNSQLPLGFDGFAFCLLALGLVGYTYRAQTVRDRVSYWCASQVCHPPAHLIRPMSGTSTRIPMWKRAWGLGIYLSYLVANVVAAMFLLVQLPISMQMREQWLQRSIADGYNLWPGATILVLCVAAGLIMAELSWRQMTSSQSRLYLRSTFMTHHHWDLRMIVRRQLRRKRKGEKNALDS